MSHKPRRDILTIYITDKGILEITLLKKEKKGRREGRKGIRKKERNK